MLAQAFLQPVYLIWDLMIQVKFNLFVCPERTDKKRRKEDKMAKVNMWLSFSWQFDHNFSLNRLIVCKELTLEHWRGEWCPVILIANRWRETIFFCSWRKKRHCGCSAGLGPPVKGWNGSWGLFLSHLLLFEFQLLCIFLTFPQVMIQFKEFH